MRPSLLVPLALTLLTATLLAGCTSPNSARDADSDGLTDVQERFLRTISVETANGSVSLRVDSDPREADTDGDGLSDLDESVRGTNPKDVDTDGDGLLDGSNVTVDPDGPIALAWRTRGILEHPTDRGTFLGEFPFCAPARLKPAQWDSDRPFTDGLGDGDELRGWTVTVRGESRHVQGDPCTPDADNDGARDLLERELGTDPRLRDTDGDGDLDGYDADPLWNLGLALTGIDARAANGTVRLTLQVGAQAAHAVPARGEDALALDVMDTTTDRTTLRVEGILSATDAETGEPIAVFPTGADLVVAFDLVQGTLEARGVEAPFGHDVSLQGEGGSVAFAWSTTRT